MIIHHPDKSGWLIKTAKVAELLLANYQLILPDGAKVSPLYEFDSDFSEDDLDGVREYALLYVRQAANDAESGFDDRITSSPTKAIFLNTEIVEYYKQGRPANPAANVFVVADAMATRRGITLHDMLEILFLKWRAIQTQIAAIVTELDRLIEAIEAAVTIEEIQAILESINFG